MDLGAYANIEELSTIAKENGIEIPRSRGYRLMKDEKAVSQNQIDAMKKYCAIDVTKRLCESVPYWSYNADFWFCCETDAIKDYYLMKKDGHYIDIHWNRIHGWKRKILKFAIKKEKQKIQNQWDMWNKYAGKENVLYIHSRMGGNNWLDLLDAKERAKIIQSPWFLDRVDDCGDDTYCDFYAKIK